jgi:hypothetical protein
MIIKPIRNIIILWIFNFLLLWKNITDEKVNHIKFNKTEVNNISAEYL